MSIIDELMAGTVKFQVREDGAETTERRPPTALSIRAANTIKSISAQYEGLERAYNTLIKQHNELQKEFDEKRSMVPERMADEGVDSVRPVSGVSEESGGETEAGQTPEAA